MGFLYYAASRLYSEQAAFNTPWGFVREAPVVTNISPVGFSLATDLVNIVKLFATQEEYKSSGGTYEKGDLKWDLIPFYEYLLTNYNLGFETRILENKKIRYSALQLLKSDLSNKYMPILVNLDKKDLINKDLSEYDEYYLSCISFYMNSKI